MHRTVSTWTDFCTHWGGPQNFLMAGPCVPFHFDMPPLDRVVDEVRRDEEARIGAGLKGARLDLTDIAATFRQLPIEQAMHSPFSLAHFHLSRFDAPGRCLHGFKERVLDPWQASLAAAGFTWQRCYPIIFISGPGCATNYHMDFSHVLAWQVYGHKRFCGLKDPDRWAPHAARIAYVPTTLEKPAALTDDDALCYDMLPGAVLWNILLTPHWVDAGDHAAMSINLSHGDLRYRGQLSPFEQELDDYRQQKPDKAPQRIEAAY